MNNLAETWVYLSASPLFHLTLTLAAFQIASFVFEKGGRNPLLNPVLGAVALVVALLALTGTDYFTYFEGAQFVHFLLGPATVALAIPLYRQWHHVRASWLAIGASMLTGSLAAIVTAVATLWFAGNQSQPLLQWASPESWVVCPRSRPSLSLSRAYSAPCSARCCSI